MRYNFPETVEFWRIGYKLFKGKFLRFMGGPKSSGHVIDDSETKGKFSPEESQVTDTNFNDKTICLHLSSAQFDYLLKSMYISLLLVMCFSDIRHCGYQSDFDQTLVFLSNKQYSKCSKI